MVPWSSASFSAVLRNHDQVSEFSVHFFALSSFSAIPTSPPQGEKNLKILIFKLIWPFQSQNTMPNWRRSHRSHWPSRHHDRSLSESPPIRRKTLSSPPSPGGKSLDSILQTLQQMQTEMTKTSERISTMESLFEQHSWTFAPLHPTPDDQISVLAIRMENC